MPTRTPVTVWTLTVDGPNSSGISTSVLATEAECLESLRDNYMDGDDDAPADDAELVEYATSNGYVIYLDIHTVEVPV